MLLRFCCNELAVWSLLNRPSLQVAFLVCGEGMNEWTNENEYMAHEKIPHKTLRVHNAKIDGETNCDDCDRASSEANGVG